VNAACRHCDRVRPIRHRGLCAGCYSGYRHLYPVEKRAWTTRDVRTAVEMRLARATRKQIAAALGRTANAVSRRLARLGVLKGRPAERRAG
jgi:hypothetical protein